MSVQALTRPRRLRVPAPVVLAAVVAVLVGYIAVTLLHAAPATVSTRVPQDPGMEQATGVRFSRVAVVGDGGLLTVDYVVLDVEKAAAFQADRAHVPALESEAREAGTRKVSIMKPGHLIRAGQTYYLVYENTAGALRPGETVTIRYRSHVLRHVPVL